MALAQAPDGKVTEALETIEKALQMNRGELSWRPEAIRIRGELPLSLREQSWIFFAFLLAAVILGIAYIGAYLVPPLVFAIIQFIWYFLTGRF